MDEQPGGEVERRCDVAVIGGSAAGLAAALQLVRQRRSVVVVDSGEPRNAPAAHMHGFLGHDGLPPAELVALGRSEVAGYGGEILPGRAVAVTRADDRFAVALEGGGTILARRVLAATGLVDVLPAIDGLAEHWGGDVIHCPFCHGYETRDRRIVQIVTNAMGLHPTALFHHLSDRLTLVLHAGICADDPGLAPLRAAGVEVIDARAARLVTGDDGHIAAVELAEGGRVDADVVVVSPSFHARAEPFEPLGLTTTPHASGLGDFLPAEPTGETAVPGVYAAGNVTEPGQQVLNAASNGSLVGSMIAFSLAEEDLRAA